MKRSLLAANVGALLLVVGYGVVEYGAPIFAAYWWRDQYKELMFKCDHVMREHFIAKRSAEVNPNERTIRTLEAAELGLVDCHDYDVLRKRLLVWNVSSNQLSLIGLEALEEKKYELRDFVRIHEIRY